MLSSRWDYRTFTIFALPILVVRRGAVEIAVIHHQITAHLAIAVDVEAAAVVISALIKAFNDLVQMRAQHTVVYSRIINEG